jgi:hypothetical protein
METTTFKPKDEVLNFMPAITFKNGVLEITGRAVSANSKYVFDPILWELYLYSLKPKDITIINIRLDYLNSESNRALMNILILAEKMVRHGHKVKINWYYEDNDDFMLEQGNVFKAIINVPFQFVHLD